MNDSDNMEMVRVHSALTAHRCRQPVSHEKLRFTWLPRDAAQLAPRWTPMNVIRTIACLGSLLSSAASAAELPDANCPEGEVVQWIADYCMLTLETDDEIIAGECIAKELKAASENPCHAKRHYKTAMCQRIVARDGTGSTEQCVADRGFHGSTVKNGGVGAQQQIPADGPSPTGSVK